MQRVGQGADQRDHRRAKRLERARLMIVTNGPQHGAALAMAAVEYTAQFVVVVQKGIGLIDQ
jgi:hypothetical protein